MLCLKEEEKQPISRLVLARKSLPKLSVFVSKCIAVGIARPVDMKAEYEALYPYAKKKTVDAFSWQCKKLGFTKDSRNAQAIHYVRQETQKHILDYPEVAAYERAAREGRTQKKQINRQKKALTKLWELMNYTSPYTWTYDTILDAIDKKYPYITDAQDRTVRQFPHAALALLTAVNTIFLGKLPRGFGKGYRREGGELKDYFTFEEFDLFCANLNDSAHLCLEGWEALFKAQVNLGSREGKLLKTGILSLRWEDIDYSLKRCSLHEKGGHGNAGRCWKNLPLDLFSWLQGWDALMLYHKKRYGYVPNNEHHAQGRAFAVTYREYNEQFHAVRHRCNGRVSGDKETMRPHVLRMTHAQWLVELGVEIPEICGSFPDGEFGVGWDNSAILLKYYISLSKKRIQKALATMNEGIKELGLQVEKR